MQAAPSKTLLACAHPTTGSYSYSYSSDCGLKERPTRNTLLPYRVIEGHSSSTGAGSKKVPCTAWTEQAGSVHLLCSDTAVCSLRSASEHITPMSTLQVHLNFLAPASPLTELHSATKQPVLTHSQGHSTGPCLRAAASHTLTITMLGIRPLKKPATPWSRYTCRATASVLMPCLCLCSACICVITTPGRQQQRQQPQCDTEGVC